MVSQTSQATQLSSTFSGPSLVLCRFPHYQSRVSGLSLAQVSCFCGYPHYGHDIFAHIIALTSLGLVFRSSVYCLAVDLCICFYQLLDEGSMMTIKVVTNLINRGRPVQLLSPLFFMALAGVILVGFLRISLVPGFNGFLNQDISFLPPPLCPFPISTMVLLMFFFSLSFSLPHFPASLLPPPNSNFLRISCLITFPKGIHVCFS